MTRPVAFVPGLLITQPGPRVTTMCGYTDTGTGPTRFCAGPIYGPLLERGFPATTGTVFVQQTKGSGGDAFFTAMGSDMRTPFGAGNIGLVSGGLAHSVHGSSICFAPRARFDEIRLSLSPQVSPLTPSGLAAAAALVLLGAGYAEGRRRSARRR